MSNRDIQNTLAVFKREFLAYFNSPVFYVIVIIFLLATNGFTFGLAGLLDYDDVSLSGRFFAYHPWIYTVLAPAVGMRLWSEEHRLGTIELLMTMPVSQWQAIVGKFLAASVVWLIALSLTFPIVWTVSYLGNPDSGPIISGYVASYFYAMACLAVTSAISAFTRSQVICLVISVFVCFVIGLIGHPFVTHTLVNTLPAKMEWMVGFISYFSFMDHFYELTKGIFVMRDVLYFISVIIVSLLVTDLGLRSKRA
ncbi:ABC transporter permease [Prosthecobacter sp.]|uniref:ABC transporter permease n=1 Tax=Prosthecobacter sp. TaxID=1965333 RepID=UPI0037841A37